MSSVFKQKDERGHDTEHSVGRRASSGKTRQFAKNSFWLVVSTAIIMIVGATYRPIIARFLGPTEYGQYAFIQVFIAYFLLAASFGIRAVVMREIGRDAEETHAYLSAAYKLRSITTVSAIAVCCATGYLLNRSEQVTLGIYVLSLSIVGMMAADLFEAILISFQRSFYIAVASLVGNLLRLGLGVTVLMAGYGLIGVLWVFVFSSSVTAAITWYFMRKVLREKNVHPLERGKGEASKVRYVLKEALPFFVIGIAGKFYAKNDIFFLALMRGDKVTGLYSVAYVVVDILIKVGSSIYWAAYPIVSRLYADEKQGRATMRLPEAYERLHKHMLMLFLPISVLLMSFGKEMLLLIFGKAYLGGLSALNVLVWIPVAEVSCLVSGNFLAATYRQGLEARIGLAMALVNVVWTVSFIFLYGALGAAIATIGASTINAVVRFYYIGRSLGAISSVTAWVKPILCAALVMPVVWFTSDMFWISRLGILIGAFVAATLIVRPYDSEDRRMLLSVFGR